MCARDFNEIAKAHEKLGGRPRLVRQMEAFREVLDECGFKDLGFVGGKYTWFRGQGDNNTIWERLDRAIATVEWIEMFLATKVLHLGCRSFRSLAYTHSVEGYSKEMKKTMEIRANVVGGSEV